MIYPCTGNDYSVSLPFWEIGGFEPRGFEPWSSQADDLKIDPCHFLARRLALLGYGKDWLAGQDNVTECDITSCCWQPVPPSGAAL